MKRKRFLAAFLTGVLVLTQAAPALAADGFDAASSDAYFAENEDAYEDELESPDEDQEDLDAVNEDPAGTAMSEGAEAVFDEDGADAETPDEIAEGTESADGIDPADDVYVADGIEDGVEEGAEVPDGEELSGDIASEAPVSYEDEEAVSEEAAADAEAEDEAAGPELGAASSDSKANGDERMMIGEHPNRLFDDAEDYRIDFHTEGIDEARILDYFVNIGLYDENAYGGEGGIVPSPLADGKYELNKDEGYLWLDKSLVKTFRDEGQNNLDFFLAAIVSDEGQNSHIVGEGFGLELCEAYEDYDKEEDRDVLPGWDGSISGSRGVWIENAQNPEGYGESYSVTKVEIEDGENLLADYHWDKNSPDDYWWYWRVKEDVAGTITFRIYYEDLQGQKQSYLQNIHVGGDVFNVHMDSPENRYEGLPGDTLTFYTDATHEYLDENKNYHKDRNDLSYEWGFEEGDQYGTITADGENASLKLKMPEGERHGHGRIFVRVKYKGNEVGYNSIHFNASSYFDQIWPTDLDKSLDKGASLKDVVFTVRRYDNGGTTAEGYNADHYRVLENVTFAWEGFDSNAVQFRDSKGKVLQNGERATGSRFTITRLGDWGTDFRLRAYWDEDGEEQEVDRNYQFDWKNYNIEFDRHDQDIFDDAEQAVVSLDMGELGENWDKRYGLEITMGVWENEQWTKLLDPDELGMRESHDANKTVLYINDIEKLFEATEGRDIRLLAEIGINTTTLCETDAWLHLRNVEYNYWDDERQFPGDMFFISKDEGRTFWVENSERPEGEDMHVKVKAVSIESEESATDSRPVAKAFDDDDGEGWDIKAIREGDATVTLTLELYEFTDGGEKFYKEVTDTFQLHVMGFIAHVGLESSSGSFDLMPGKGMTILPETDAGYLGDDGNYHEEDVAQNPIRYEFRLDDIDNEWREKNADGDWKEAFRKTFEDGLWSVSVPGDAGKKLVWNEEEESYSLTVGGADRSIAVNSKAGSPWMRLWIRAELLTDDLEGSLAETSRHIEICEDLYEIELADAWKTNLLPGQTATVNPSLVCYRNGQKDETFDSEDVRWRLEWEQRSGIDFEKYGATGEVIFKNEWDRQHVGIKDADGQVFRYDGNQTVDSGRAPFTVQRFVEWSTRVELIAEFKENGEDREARRTLYLEPVSVKAGISSNPARGGEEQPARFYTGESFTVEADVEQLEAIGAEWTFTAGRWRWDGENERDVFDPLYTYDVDSDGKRIESSRKPFAFTASELSGKKLTLGGGDRMKEIGEALRYEYNEWGDAVAGFDMNLSATLNGVLLINESFPVQIADSIVRMEDEEEWTMPGSDFFYKDGKAMLYVENENHQGGSGDERGDSYEVTITNITVISGDHESLVPEKVDGKGWYIRALKPGFAEVTYTFTGGPDGITEHTSSLYVTDVWYYVDYEADRTLYPGETDAVNLKLKKDVYNPETKEIEYGKDVTSSFKVDYYYDRQLLNLNEETGKFTVDENARYGNTRIDFWVHDVEEYPHYETYEQINVHISGIKTELDIDDQAKFAVVPGETYSIDQLKSLLPKQMLVKSMKNQDGTKKDAAEYFFEGGRPAVFSFSGPNGEGRPWTKVTINEDILDWIEDGAVRPVQIRGKTADGEEAVDELNLVIHNHKWSKVTYTWAKDNKTVTATRKCTVDGCTKTETETVKTTAKVTTPATCTAKGKTTYTATFKNAAFAKQTKVLENIAALGHKWDSGKVTKAATVTAAGVKTFTCIHDKKHTKTQVIPKLPNPEGNVNDPATVAGAEKKIAKVADNAEPEGSSFATIQLQSKKQTKDSITFAWNSVPGASGYIIFGNACGKANSLERIAKQSGTGYAAKGLKANTYYKYMVAAYKKVGGSEKIIGLSKVAHVTTKGKNTNVSKIKVNKKKVTLAKKGKTFKLKATEVKQSKKGKLKRHRKVKYESSDPTVATVDAKGRIKAKKKGKCVIYVYSQNGTYAKVKVTVKK